MSPRPHPAAALPAPAGGIVHAAANTGRALALGGVLVLLLVMRTEASILVNFGMTAAAVFGLYLVFGRAAGMRLLVLYLIGFGLFDQLRAFADDTGVPTSVDYVIGFERGLFGSVPSVWLQDHLYVPGRTGPIDIAASLVYVSYFVAVHAVALLIWLRDRRHFPMFAAAVLLTFYLGLLVCFILPTAPPWLAGRDGHIAPVHRVFQEIVSQKQPDAYDHGAAVAGINDVAAMPSLHMAITVIIAIEGWRRRRLLGILGVLYAGSMAFALSYLGEHYVMDEIAGGLIAGASWLIAVRFWRLRGVAAPATVEGAAFPRPALGEVAAGLREAS